MVRKPPRCASDVARVILCWWLRASESQNIVTENNEADCEDQEHPGWPRSSCQGRREGNDLVRDEHAMCDHVAEPHEKGLGEGHLPELVGENLCAPL